MLIRTIVAILSRRYVFAAFLPFLFLFQGCQSDTMLGAGEETSSEVQLHPSCPIVPTSASSLPVVQRATLSFPTQSLPHTPDDLLPKIYGGYHAFGAQAWWDHFGVRVDGQPAIPEYLVSQLEDPCPFWPEKKVRETHLLTLIPGKVDGKDYTLNRLGALVQNENGFRFYNPRVKKQYGDVPSGGPYWLLMTYDVIPGSRDKKYKDQRSLIRDHLANKKRHLDYVLPLGLEAATSILAHYAKTKERLFEDDLLTYTRCHASQPISGVWYGSYPCMSIGGFGYDGLFVGYFNPLSRCSHAHEFVGVAVCRKF